MESDTSQDKNLVIKKKRVHHDVSKRTRLEPVGIRAIGWYLPEKVITAAEIAAQAGVPVEIITNHIGMKCKHIAGPDDHPSVMAEKAARQCMENHAVSPDEIDLLIYTYEGPLDWNGWSPAASLQNRLGIHHAFAFDIHNACCGANIGMTVAAGLMHRDPDIHSALVMASVHFSGMGDYSDPATHGFWMFSDGAAAAVIQRDEPSNTILSYAEITEPGLADLVRVPLGGTRLPFTPDPALVSEYKYA